MAFLLALTPIFDCHGYFGDSSYLGNETVQPDNPQTRGKIAKIGYLVAVTEEE